MPTSTMWALLLLTVLSFLIPGSQAQRFQGTKVQDTQPPSGLSASPKLSACLNDFSFSLYHHLARESNTSNIIFSPVSIASALALLALGAQGETHHQILEVMHFNISQISEAKIHHGFQHLLHSLNQSDRQLQLSMGRSLLIQEGLKLAEKFLEDAKTLYHSEVFSTNFKNPEEAKKQINDYVEKGTQGKIMDLVTELDENIVLSLMDYIFFKGTWNDPFDSDLTREQTFHVDELTTVKVPMMNTRGMFASAQYSDLLSSWVLLLDYEGNATAVFLLPDQGKMQHLEDTLSPELLLNLLDNKETIYATVHVPKMFISGTYDLKAILSSLGISRVFTDMAELSGIAEDTALKVSQTVHKTVLTMDEKGREDKEELFYEITTELVPQPIKFEHPFLLIIFDHVFKVPLFVGKVMNPTQA